MNNETRIRLLLKPDEAAAALAISPRTLWGLTSNGELPCLRIGRAVRYDPRDLTCWIDRRKTCVNECRTTSDSRQK